MLAKVRAGGTGYDIVVPSDYTVKIMIEEGLLAETQPNQMPNFKNVKPQFVDIYWDTGRHYSVPWQFGTTAFAVNTAKYKGDIDTYAILFNPPDELKGRSTCWTTRMSVIHAAERYLGVPRCGGDKANLKKVNDAAEQGQAVLAHLQLRHHHQDDLGRCRRDARPGTAPPIASASRSRRSNTPIPRKASRAGWTTWRC